MGDEMYLKSIIASIIICLVWAGSSMAGYTEAEILQYKSDRLYFSLGEDDLVFEGCPFVLTENGDTLANGIISHALSGISESAPIEIKLDTENLGKYSASICSAVKIIDRLIRVGILHDDRIEQFVPRQVFKNELRTIRYNSISELLLAYENSEIDGIFGLKNSFPIINSGNLLAYPSTEYAALIPVYDDRAVNHTTLTTALYYYFNHEMFDIFYEGDEIMPRNSHLNINNECRRIYEYDPRRGKSLLGSLDSYNQSVSNKSRIARLETVSRYFNDVLFRNISNDQKETAISATINFIPIFYQPNSNRSKEIGAVNYILQYLDDNYSSVFEKISSLKESVGMLRNYLDQYTGADNEQSRRDFADKINRILIEDLGIFPLFRPTAFFIYHDNLKGASANDDELLEIDNMFLIKMPDESTRD